MIDSHCHLTAPDFDADRDEVVSRSLKSGITHMVTISDRMGDIAPSQELSEKYPEIFFTAGVHPHHASEFSFEKDLEELKEVAKHPKCCGIGEIGLDYHYMRSPKDMQQRVFEVQLSLAKELTLPAVVHCRDAIDDIITIVRHVKPEKLVIHCCTEEWPSVAPLVEMGYLLSFTGIATFPKSETIRKTIQECPIESMMLETDAPYLAPVPCRGKRCEPVHVLETAKVVATLKGLSLQELDEITSKTAKEFFGM